MWIDQHLVGDSTSKMWTVPARKKGIEIDFTQLNLWFNQQDCWELKLRNLSMSATDRVYQGENEAEIRSQPEHVWVDSGSLHPLRTAPSASQHVHRPPQKNAAS